MARAVEERRMAIIQKLVEEGIVRVVDLSQTFGVSQVSIRRDLTELERRGLLKRIHGGAISLPRIILERSHNEKMRHHIEEKRRIGRAAADMIREGEIIILESGTTVLQVARHISRTLLSSGPLTVITSSIPIIHELGSWKGVHLIVLGGVYLPEQEVLVGPQTISHLIGLHADKFFTGADGFTLSYGVTTATVLEAETVRAMVNAAREVIAVFDSSKIGNIALTTSVPLTQITTLITDVGAPADFVAAVRERGIEVILV